MQDRLGEADQHGLGGDACEARDSVLGLQHAGQVHPARMQASCVLEDILRSCTRIQAAAAAVCFHIQCTELRKHH
jgi:hypothetical protein